MRFLLVSVIVAFILGLLFFQLENSNTKHVYNISKSFPTITLLDANIKKIINSSTLGNSYVISISASWCKFCRLETRYLERIKNMYNMPIYGINYKDPEYVVKDHKIFNKVFKDDDGQALIALGGTGVPETLIVKNGMIIYHLHGPINESIYEDQIIPILDNIVARHQ